MTSPSVPSTPHEQPTAAASATLAARPLAWPGNGDRVNLGELLYFHDRDFVVQCYRAVLRREPDAEGLSMFVEHLRAGRYTPIEVLGQLRYSREGKRHGVKIRGLLFKYWLNRGYHIPVLGNALRLTTTLLRLGASSRTATVNGDLWGELTSLRDLAVTLNERARTEFQTSLQMLASRADHLEAARTDLQKSLQDMTGHAEHLATVIADARQRHDGVQQQVNQLDGAFGDLRGFSESLEGQGRELLEAQAELKAHYANLLERHDALESHLINAQSAIHRLSSDGEGKQALLAALQREFTQVHHEHHDLLLRLEERVQATQAAQAEQGRAHREEVGVLTNRFGELRALQERVGRLEGNLTALNAGQEQRLAELSEQLRAGLNPLRERIDALAALPARLDGVDARSTATEQRLDEMHSRHSGLAERLAAEVGTLKERTEGIVTVQEHVSRVEVGLTAHSTAIDQRVEELQARHAELADRLRGEVEPLARRIDALSVLQDQLKQVESGLAEQQTATDQRIAEVRTLQSDLVVQMRRELEPLARDLERLNPIQERIDRLGSAIAHTEEQLHQSTDEQARALVETESSLSRLKRDTVLQERRLSLLLEEARKRLPEPLSVEVLETMRTEGEHMLDAAYVDFENTFRGSREDIKRKQSVYLKYVIGAGTVARKSPLLDIGCGRGEWLEVLAEHELPAKGVDLSRVLAEGCRQDGYEVIEADALAYLRGLKDSSLGAVSGFHIVEHLPMPRLIALFDECLRVLKPGAPLIFETPNPDNLLVGARYFYLDPTHLRPIPHELLTFLAEVRGFCRVTVLPLNPWPQMKSISKRDSEFIRMMKELVFGPQDYGLVAYKP